MPERLSQPEESELQELSRQEICPLPATSMRAAHCNQFLSEQCTMLNKLLR